MSVSPDVAVAIIGALGLILSGVLVELIRTRRRADKVASQTQRVVQAVTPNHGSSLRDAVDRIDSAVQSVQSVLTEHGERLAVVETLVTRKRWRS